MGPWRGRLPSMMLAASFLILAQAASPSGFLASTSQATDLPGHINTGAEAVLYRWQGAPVRPFLADDSWRGVLGDRDLDGLHDLPEGIDALSFGPRVSGEERGLHSLWFSTDRDGPGYQDGDILMLDGMGSLQVIHTETALLNHLAPSSGGLDLDAMSRRGDGKILFSLRDGLQGTVVGDIEDGDVLLWDARTGVVSRYASEAEVQAWVDQATGGTSAVGDVKSLSWMPSGELCFTVQSPSGSDATVYSDGGGGTVYSGWLELDWGFLGAVEIDALAFMDAQDSVPSLLEVDVESAAPGETFELKISHAMPGERLQFQAGVAPLWLLDSAPGLGLRVIHPGAGPSATFPSAQATPLYAGNDGCASISVRLPSRAAAIAGFDVLIQGGGASSGLSTPVRLRVL